MIAFVAWRLTSFSGALYPLVPVFFPLSWGVLVGAVAIRAGYVKAQFLFLFWSDPAISGTAPGKPEEPEARLPWPHKGAVIHRALSKFRSNLAPTYYGASYFRWYSVLVPHRSLVTSSEAPSDFGTTFTSGPANDHSDDEPQHSC